MSTNPNTVKSQHELNPCNDGKRSSDVLVETISKLETTTKENELLKEIIKDEMVKNGEILEEIERLQKQLDIAVNTLKCYANPDNWDYNRFTNFFATWKLASDNLEKIKEQDNVSR